MREPRFKFGLVRLLSLAIILILSVSGCATHYVDASLRDMAPTTIRKVEPQKPVQLVFEFQTKGVSNGRATNSVRDNVAETVRQSHLFTSVQWEPVPGGDVVSVVINNVPLADDAFAKGFVTGLTFGLAGNTVTDGYVCTVKYLPQGSSQAVEVKARHAIHTTLGASGAPANGIKAKSIQEAVMTMVNQLVSKALDELASNKAFQQVSSEGK